MSDALHIVCPLCGAVNRVAEGKPASRARCGKCRGALFSGHPVELGEGNFAAQVDHSRIPVVVDFWAPWCGPCRSMAPVFEEAARLLEPDFRLARVNTEKERMLASRFDIRAVPTTVIFMEGRELTRRPGAMDLSTLMEWIRSFA